MNGSKRQYRCTPRRCLCKKRTRSPVYEPSSERHILILCESFQSDTLSRIYRRISKTLNGDRRVSSFVVARECSARTLQLTPRHVAKTDDIKDFVITEESSIAKGIRRIVAVTGFEANEVSRKAKDYEARLERADAMQRQGEGCGAQGILHCECHLRKPKWENHLLTLREGAGPEQYFFDSETTAQRKVREDPG